MAPYFRKSAKTHVPSENAQGTYGMNGGSHGTLGSEGESGPLCVAFGDGFDPNNAA